MRFILKTLFTLITLVILAAGAIMFLVPRDVIRDQAIALVNQQTGRTLTVGGETSIAFYPDIGVQLEDVALSNPPEMQGGPMLRMASLTLNLKLIPLMTRSVQVERFTLVRPVFDLQVDAKGRRNWDFNLKAADAGVPERVTAAETPATEMPQFIQAQAGGLGGGAIQDIRLGALRIEEGILLYTDAGTGTKERLDAINMSLTQKDLAQPLNATGDFIWKGEKVDIKGQVGTVTALTRGGPSAVNLDVSSAHVKTKFDGRVVLGDAFTAAGTLTGSTPSVRNLAGWSGNPLASPKGFGPASLSGDIKFADKVLTFSKTKISLDGMNGQGNGSVSLKGAKPYIRAAFAIDTLNLNNYVGPGKAPAYKPRATAPASNPAPTANPAPVKPKDGQSLTDFIEDLNKKPVTPQVRAWSQRAMNFAGLNTVDADVNVNAGALLFDKIKVGQSSVSASLKKGVLTADLTKLQLYGGQGTGRVTVNGARAVPAFATAFDLRGLSALPFLKDAADFKWISGKANLALNVSGTGRTQNEMVRTLNGNGSLNFSNGAIEGINIPEMVRGLKQGQFGGWKSANREKTDFSSLTGTFSIQNGIASNGDLSLIGPLLRVSGRGIVNLPSETLDYTMSPRVVASLQGQGTAQQLDGIVIPVRINGRWDNPQVKPDLKRIIENPEAAVDTVKKIGKALKGAKGNDVESILKGVLGNQQGGQAQQPGGQSQQEVRPEDILKQLFKKN